MKAEDVKVFVETAEGGMIEVRGVDEVTLERSTTNAWFMCEHPERPVDENTWVHDQAKFSCQPCLIALEALVARDPQQPVYDVVPRTPENPWGKVTAAELLANGGRAHGYGND